MNPEYTPLAELHPKIGPYKIRVKVVDKARPQYSPKNTKYLRMRFQDDSGTIINAALFGPDIETYDDVIKLNGTYEIGNATVKAVPEPYRSAGNEHQLAFSSKTYVRAVGNADEDNSPVFSTIATIPRTGTSVDRINVLAVVIYVEDVREVQTSGGRKSDVREIVITDNSSNQLVTISAWRDLAGRDSPMLTDWANSFAVVGFTALVPSTHKGFSLATTMSTEFILKPQGPRSEILCQWVAKNRRLLLERQMQVEDVRKATQDNTVLTIQELLKKQANQVLPEQRYWLRVQISLFTDSDLHPYLGCESCGTRCEFPKRTIFTCVSCRKEDAISGPRVYYNFEASDETGKILLTAFGAHAELLLKHEKSELYDVIMTNDTARLAHIKEMVEGVSFFVQVGPSGKLARENLLRWVLKSVAFELPLTVDASAEKNFSQNNSIPLTSSNVNPGTSLQFTPPSASSTFSQDCCELSPTDSCEQDQMPISSLKKNKSASATSNLDEVATLNPTSSQLSVKNKRARTRLMFRETESETATGTDPAKC